MNRSMSWSPLSHVCLPIEPQTKLSSPDTVFEMRIRFVTNSLTSFSSSGEGTICPRILEMSIIELLSPHIYYTEASKYCRQHRQVIVNPEKSPDMFPGSHTALKE